MYIGGESKKKKNLIQLLIVSGLLFAAPVFTNAASIILNPSSGSYAVGSTIPVDVFVDTEGETINAVSATIAYPDNILIPSSIKRSDSIVNLWVQPPAASQTAPEVTFEGLILNPGFNGKGKVATINFEVFSPGTAEISLVSGLTLANDGFGTNILSTTQGSTFETHGAEGQQIATGDLELPVDPTELVFDSLRPPVVTGYTARPKTIREFFVQGVTYPNAEVRLWLKHPQKDVEEYLLAADGAGNFSYRYGSAENLKPILQAAALSSLTGNLEGIQYRFWLTAQVAGSETPPTQAFDVVVGGLGVPELLLIVIILLVLGVVALLVFEMILLRRVYDRDEDHKQKVESGINNINQQY